MSEIEFKHRLSPRPHQMEAWLKSRDREYFAFFMEMGTGKSKVAIDTGAWLWLRGLIDNVLLVAPKGVYRNWAGEWTSSSFANPDDVDPDMLPEIPKHMSREVPWFHAWYDADGLKAERDAVQKLIEARCPQLRILSVNAESLAFDKGITICEDFLLSGRTLFIIDESTCIKHEKAKRTKAAIALGRRAKYRRIMCGNPFANGPLDVYAPCRFLHSAALGFSSYFSFRGRFARLIKMKVRVPGKVKKDGTPLTREFDKVDGYKDLNVLRQILDKFSFFKRKDECLDLPPKVMMLPRTHSMTERQQRAYDDMRRYSVAMISDQLTLDGSIDVDSIRPGVVSSAPIVLTQMLRLQQIACGFMTTDEGDEVDLWTDELKVNPRVQSLMDLLEEHRGKAIIFANFTRNVDQICAALAERYGADSVVRFDGTVDGEDIMMAPRRFQDAAGKVRWFVANESKGSRGITLTAASLVVYFSNTPDNEIREQSEDRAHRDGLRHSVSYVDLRSDAPKGNADDKVRMILRSKGSLAAMIRDGSWRSLFED